MHSRINKQLNYVVQRIKSTASLCCPKNTKIEPEPSLRAELFSEEQMASHALKLASKHELSPTCKPVKLLERLQQNENLLRECCKCFFDASAGPNTNQPLTPAGEWIIDNYWLLEEQILETRKNS